MLNPRQAHTSQKSPTPKLLIRFIQVETIFVMYVVGEALHAGGEDRIEGSPIISQ